MPVFKNVHFRGLRYTKTTNYLMKLLYVNMNTTIVVSNLPQSDCPPQSDWSTKLSIANHPAVDWNNSKTEISRVLHFIIIVQFFPSEVEKYCYYYVINKYNFCKNIIINYYTSVKWVSFGRIVSQIKIRWKILPEFIN